MGNLDRTHGRPESAPARGAGVAYSRTKHRIHAAGLLVLALPLAIAFALLSATGALAITRNTSLARAQAWVDHPVRYSQAKHHLGYRTDCSGYVSMCWRTGTSWSTRSFHTVTHRISHTQLRPGDAMLKKGYHIRLFYGWLDPAHTTYVAYEAGSGTVAVCRIHSLAEDLAFGYVPTRYDRIAPSPASSNLLHNGSFDSWARSWGPADEAPVWWQLDGPWWERLAAHRKKVFRSANNSLQLLNPSDDAETTSQLSQDASVTAGAPYRFSAWARTAFDPAGVEIALTYLDALGQPVSETTASASAFGIGNGTFARMSVTETAPPTAVVARTSIRLSGGASADTSCNPVPGASVLLDDLSLTRP
jgi:hypothetical protein